MSRAKTKTALLSLRVRPEVREVLLEAAEAENRSMANMAEVLLLEGCKQRGFVAGSPLEPMPQAKSIKPPAGHQ